MFSHESQVIPSDQAALVLLESGSRQVDLEQQAASDYRWRLLRLRLPHWHCYLLPVQDYPADPLRQPRDRERDAFTCSANFTEAQEKDSCGGSQRMNAAPVLDIVCALAQVS